jgi:hypothetical protein
MINKVILPDIAQGDYWIFDNNFEEILKIEGHNNLWQIRSNDDIKVINRKRYWFYKWKNAKEETNKI